MTKSDKIRDYVKANGWVTVDEVIAATKLERNFVNVVCGQRARKGEFRRDNAGRYSANPDWQPLPRGGAGHKSKRKPKRLKGFKQLAREKTMRDVRLAVTEPPARPDVRPLVVLSLASLESVIDLAACDETVRAAMATHRAAVELLRA